MQAYTQALALVYLLCATFQKGHSSEPVPSGGAGLGGAQGHLSDPTTRRAGGGVKGGGRQAGGGGETTRRGQRQELPFKAGRGHRYKKAGLSGQLRQTEPTAVYAHPVILLLKQAVKQYKNGAVVHSPHRHTSPNSLIFKKLMMKIAAYTVCIHSLIPAN